MSISNTRIKSLPETGSPWCAPLCNLKYDVVVPILITHDFIF